MKRYSTLFITLLLISSLYLLVYDRPATRVEVDPIENTSFMFKVDTNKLLLKADSDFTFNIQIFSQESNYTTKIIDQQNLQGSNTIDLPRAGIYFIILSSDTIGSIRIQSSGMPLSYTIYIAILLVLSLISLKDQILGMFL